MFQLIINEEQLKAFKFAIDFVTQHNFMTLEQSNELCGILRNPIDIEILKPHATHIPVPNSEHKPDKFIGTWKTSEEGTIVVIYDTIKKVSMVTHKNTWFYLGLVMVSSERILPEGGTEENLNIAPGLWDVAGNFVNRYNNRWDIRERIREKAY